VSYRTKTPLEKPIAIMSADSVILCYDGYSVVLGDKGLNTHMAVILGAFRLWASLAAKSSSLLENNLEMPLKKPWF